MRVCARSKFEHRLRITDRDLVNDRSRTGSVTGRQVPDLATDLIAAIRIGLVSRDAPSRDQSGAAIATDGSHEADSPEVAPSRATRIWGVAAAGERPPSWHGEGCAMDRDGAERPSSPLSVPVAPTAGLSMRGRSCSPDRMGGGRTGCSARFWHTRPAPNEVVLPRGAGRKRDAFLPRRTPHPPGSGRGGFLDVRFRAASGFRARPVGLGGPRPDSGVPVREWPRTRAPQAHVAEIVVPVRAEGPSGHHARRVGQAHQGIEGARRRRGSVERGEEE